MGRKIIVALIIILTIYNFTYYNQERTLISFAVNKGLPTIDIEVNGKPARFLVDTGATSSVLNSNLSEVYGFDCKMVDGFYTRGISGVAQMGIVGDVELQINNINKTQEFKCLDLDDISYRLKIVGILGSDFLMKNKLVIDYDSRTIKELL